MDEMNDMEFLEMIADWFYTQAVIGLHPNIDNSEIIKDRLKKISNKFRMIMSSPISETPTKNCIVCLSKLSEIDLEMNHNTCYICRRRAMDNA